MNGPKIYFTLPYLGGIPITQTAVSSFVVMLLLCGSGYFLGRNLQKRPGRMQVVVEKLVTMLTIAGKRLQEKGEAEKAVSQFKIAQKVMDAFAEDFLEDLWFTSTVYDGMRPQREEIEKLLAE